MAKWIAVFAFCSVTVFAQSTLRNDSCGVARKDIARDHDRPTSETVARKHADKFKSIFADGGAFDQIHGK